jgi:hypothetical protein
MNAPEEKSSVKIKNTDRTVWNIAEPPQSGY